MHSARPCSPQKECGSGGDELFSSQSLPRRRRTKSTVRSSVSPRRQAGDEAGAQQQQARPADDGRAAALQAQLRQRLGVGDTDDGDETAPRRAQTVDVATMRKLCARPAGGESLGAAAFEQSLRVRPAGGESLGAAAFEQSLRLPSGEHVAEALIDFVVAALPLLLGAATPPIDRHAPTSELGLSSKHVVELKNLIADALQLAVPTTVFFEARTLAELADAVAGLYLASRARPSPVAGRRLADPGSGTPSRRAATPSTYSRSRSPSRHQQITASTSSPSGQLARSTSSLAPPAHLSPPTSPRLTASMSSSSSDLLADYQALLERLIGEHFPQAAAAAELGADYPLAQLGLSSQDAVRMRQLLAEQHGISLSLVTLFSVATLGQLADELRAAALAGSRSASPSAAADLVVGAPAETFRTRLVSRGLASELALDFVGQLPCLSAAHLCDWLLAQHSDGDHGVRPPLLLLDGRTLRPLPQRIVVPAYLPPDVVFACDALSCVGVGAVSGPPLPLAVPAKLADKADRLLAKLAKQSASPRHFVKYLAALLPLLADKKVQAATELPGLVDAGRLCSALSQQLRVPLPLVLVHQARTVTDLAAALAAFCAAEHEQKSAALSAEASQLLVDLQARLQQSRVAVPAVCVALLKLLLLLCPSLSVDVNSHSDLVALSPVAAAEVQRFKAAVASGLGFDIADAAQFAKAATVVAMATSLVDVPLAAQRRLARSRNRSPVRSIF